MAASFKSTIPIVIAASGKMLSRKLGTGKWDMKKLGMQFAPGWSPGHIFALTHMHKHHRDLSATTGTSITNECKTSTGEEEK